jgi:hypothetical protein
MGHRHSSARRSMRSQASGGRRTVRRSSRGRGALTSPAPPPR